MKRFNISCETIANWHTVASAAHRAARGKRNKPEVAAFFSQYESSIKQVRSALLAAKLPYGQYHSFQIFDPKPRTIRAAPFTDRVAHHALMQPLTKPLDDWQVASSFACRKGKGAHAAVAFAQKQSRCFPWYLKMDVSGYFGHIVHSRLLSLLRCRLRGEHLFKLIEFVLTTYQTKTATGLPIGALTSQHFANVYLTPADRWLIAQTEVKSHCRYMDDTVIWCDNKKVAKQIYSDYSHWLKQEWSLNLKPAIIQQSRFGLTFCGYRIRPQSIKPGKRRLRQFKSRLDYWQRAFESGKINSNTLQQNTDVLLAMLQPGASWHWRKRFFENNLGVMQ